MGSSSSTIRIEALMASVVSNSDCEAEWCWSSPSSAAPRPRGLPWTRIIDVLGDVGGVVADALHVLGAEQQDGCTGSILRGSSIM